MGVERMVGKLVDNLAASWVVLLAEMKVDQTVVH